MNKDNKTVGAETEQNVNEVAEETVQNVNEVEEETVQNVNEVAEETEQNVNEVVKETEQNVNEVEEETVQNVNEVAEETEQNDNEVEEETGQGVDGGTEQENEVPAGTKYHYESYAKMWHELAWQYLDAPYDYDALAKEMGRLKEEEKRKKTPQQKVDREEESAEHESLFAQYERHKAEEQRKQARTNKQVAVLGAVVYIAIFTILQGIFGIGYIVGGMNGSLLTTFMPSIIGVGIYGLTLIIDVINILFSKLKERGKRKGDK